MKVTHKRPTVKEVMESPVYQILKELGAIDFSVIENRLVAVDDGHTRTVAEVGGCEDGVGVTIQITDKSVIPVHAHLSGHELVCINGPLSPHGCTSEFEKKFDYGFLSVLLNGEYNYVERSSIVSGRPTPASVNLSCAFK